jgi:hypothetical protein
MIKIILVLLIILVIYKIYTTYYNKSEESYINITNPYVNGLSQFQLGVDEPNITQVLDGSDLPPQKQYDPFNPANNLIPQTENPYFNYYPDSNLDKSSAILNNINKISNKLTPKSNYDKDVGMINQMRSKTKNQNLGSKNKISGSKNKISELKNKIPCKKLNKFFIQTQFSDSYRDVLTVFNNICPDQKIFFNIQSLPVITTNYQLNRDTPFVFIKLVTQFINQVNKEIAKLPESYEIVNNNNNYMPLTSQLKKYTENKGINKFYKDIGVDYNLYADTPPNSPVELIKIISAKREYTDAETKYVITLAIKKILKSITDQLKITVHFVTKNNPLEGYDLFNGKPPTETINSTQQVAVEFIFVDGYYTDDFDVDYDCMGGDNGCKKNSNIDWDNKYYSFDALGTNFMMSDYEIIKEFNKKNREHEIEMNNFNINVPYPVYENPANATSPKFPSGNM